MKRLLTFLTLLTVFIGVGWAAEYTYALKIGSPAAWTTGTSSVSTTTSDGFTFEVTNGNGQLSNVLQSAHLRIYQNATMTITAPSGENMTSVALTCAGTSNAGQLTVGGTNMTNTAASGSAPIYTWTGTGTSTLVITGAAQCRVNSITITTDGGSSTSIAKAPTFSPNGGTFTSAQVVTISSETSGATIYYTTNGVDPTTSSSSINNGGTVTISESCTLKAMAVASDYDNSSVTSAEFVINLPGSGTKFERITDVQYLEVGKRYIIVCGNSALSGVRSQLPITISDNSTELPDNTEVNIYTLGGETGAYTFLTDGTYMANTGTSNATSLNHLAEPTYADMAQWKVTFGTTGNAIIQCDHIFGTESGRYLRGNGTSDFRCYASASNGSAVYLYKEVETVTEVPDLYILGQVNGNDLVAWNPQIGPQMYYSNIEKKYTADVYCTGLAIANNNTSTFGYSYFAFATELNTWDNLNANNAAKRYGSGATGDYWVISKDGENESHFGDAVPLYKGSQKSYQLPAGLYTLTVDLVASPNTVTVAERAVTMTVNNQTSGTTYFEGSSTATLASNLTELGGTIYYTTDGTDPSASNGTAYSEPIPISANTTVKAIAILGAINSDIATRNFYVKPAAPVITPDGGIITEATQVAIEAESGCTIYYTLDENTPTDASTVYNGPITVSSSTTIKAIAYNAAGIYSNVTTATFTYHEPASYSGEFVLVTSADELVEGKEYIIVAKDYNVAMSTTQNSNNRGETSISLLDDGFSTNANDNTQVFTLEGSTGAWYFYANHGTNMGYIHAASSNNNYLRTEEEADDNAKAAITISSSGVASIIFQGDYTRNVLQYNSGSGIFACYGSASQKAVYLYYRNASTVAKPVINPASQVFTEEFDATITCSTQGATIYYTTDGTDPTTSSAVYSSPIHVDKTMTIKAIAANDGETSAIAEAVYQCTMVENIAEYLALPIGTTDIVFKNPVIVQYHYISGSGKSYIYVKDDTGCAYFHQPYETEGTPSMTQFEKGDIIAGGFYGDKDYDEALHGAVSQYAMFTNLQNFAATGNKALVEPEEYTVSDLTADLNNHYITIKKVKLSELYQALDYGNPLYFDIDDAAHLGYNKFNIDWSVVDDLDAYYNVTAIFTAYNNNLEVHPIEIVKWAETELTLKELCEIGEEGESYRITNNLQGVYVKGTSLWVKDENGQSKDLVTPTAPYTDNFEIEHEDNTRSTQADYDQSNWLEVVCRTEAEATSLKNKIIKGYSIVGTFNKKANPKLTLSSDAEITVYGNSDVYAPNYYIPANFVGSQTCNTEQYGQEGHGNFFFMTPKPQEYAMVVWAVYDGLLEGQPTFIMSPDPARNTHQFVGTFVVDLSMNTGATSTSEIREGFGYDFEAIIRKVETRGAQNDQSASYIVYPLNLDEGQDPVTSINDVTKGYGEIKCIKYVNVAGIVSDVPFQGVNIVVTEYTDGSRTTTKMLKK